MTSPYDPDGLHHDLEKLRDELQRALDIAKTDAHESEFSYVIDPKDVDLDDEDLDEEGGMVQEAERAEIVRGRHHSEWWEELDRMRNTGDLAGAEALLIEMRDAVERSSEIAGWAIPFGPAQGLLALYKSQGDDASALVEVRRFIKATMETVKHEPTGGNTGLRRALEWLAFLDPKEGRGGT